METAKKLAFVGNILQTIWLVVVFAAGLLNTTARVFQLIPANAGGKGVLSALVFLVLVILGWIAASRLDDNTWRFILLLVAIVAFFYAGSFIAAILFLIAFFKSGSRA